MPSIRRSSDLSLARAPPRSKAQGRPLPAWNSSAKSICGPLLARLATPSPASLARVIGQSTSLPSAPNAAHPHTSQQPAACAAPRTSPRRCADTSPSRCHDTFPSALTNPS